MVIDNVDVKALKAVMDSGVIKTTAQRDKAIAYATKNKINDVLAWLMDYKNRTADVVDEVAKEEKMMRELTENPNSVSALKKKWGYKKLDDGTLVITSYKGSDEIVEVPSKIGKSTVTFIEEGAFAMQEVIKEIHNGYDSWFMFKPSGIYVHIPADSVASEDMKGYRGVLVVNDYNEKEE